MANRLAASTCGGAAMANRLAVVEVALRGARGWTSTADLERSDPHRVVASPPVRRFAMWGGGSVGARTPPGHRGRQCLRRLLLPERSAHRLSHPLVIMRSMDGDAVVVELWWCPVCGGAAHRTNRPGRPKLYCSNACRQRAYRWRRDHHARLIAPPGEPAAAAVVIRGRYHALRSGRDFVAHHRDRSGREPTVCGVLARPMRHHRARRSHTDFVPVSADACRRCADLIRPPAHPLTTVVVHGPVERHLRNSDPIAWVERLDPSHPIRRNPDRYGLLTRAWLLHRARAA
jgi:hypothetical protein